MRAVNHAVGEQRKKKKDDEEKKQQSKQRVKLQRGKRHQGSLGEKEEEEDPPSPQAWPFLQHATGQEGEDVPPEPAESNRPAPSGPSTTASELIESGHLALSVPSMAAPELVESGRPTPSEPSAAPPESAGGGRSDSSEPSEPREGSKRQRADEEQPGSSKPAPKHPRMMASG
ncbi:uncharacterized protein [Miscanthus floridulus]|uniref:uncharacterized protein n=1 Tax=Miscanthus floridulus TaxID=154761 RepID=UPI00345A5F17